MKDKYWKKINMLLLISISYLSSYCYVIGPLEETSYCGDGIIEHTSESCDDGGHINNDGCDSSCNVELSYCGDNYCHYKDSNGFKGETSSNCPVDCLWTFTPLDNIPELIKLRNDYNSDSGTYLIVRMHVDDDTYIDEVNLVKPNQSQEVAGGVSLVRTTWDSQYSDKAIPIPAGLPLGKYQVSIKLYANKTNFDNGTYTLYRQSSLGSTYYRYQYVNNIIKSSYDTSIEAEIVNIDTKAEPGLGTDYTLCSNDSMYPVKITSADYMGGPKGFKTTSLINPFTSCYYIITVPYESDPYSVSIDSLTVDFSLSAYTDNSFTTIYSPNGFANQYTDTTSEYLPWIYPNGNKEIYIKIINNDASNRGVFRIFIL